MKLYMFHPKFLLCLFIKLGVLNRIIIYCKLELLLVDKNITNAREMIIVLEDAIHVRYPILITMEDIEQEYLATIVFNNSGVR